MALWPKERGRSNARITPHICASASLSHTCRLKIWHVHHQRRFLFDDCCMNESVWLEVTFKADFMTLWRVNCTCGKEEHSWCQISSLTIASEQRSWEVKNCVASATEKEIIMMRKKMERDQWWQVNNNKGVHCTQGEIHIKVQTLSTYKYNVPFNQGMKRQPRTKKEG